MIATDPTRDHEAEQWVLQSMMIDDNAADYVMTHAKDADFDDLRHRVVYQHLVKLREGGKRFDSVLLYRSMKETAIGGKSDFDAIGGSTFLASLIDNAITSTHVRHYLARVRRATAIRNIQAATEAIKQAVLDSSPDDSVDDLASRCEQLMFDATERTLKRETLVSAKDAVLSSLERLDYRMRHGAGDGLQSGFHELDKMTGGFRKGEVVVIAARPGCGKSALASNMAETMSADSEAGLVLLVSLEMSSEEITDRMLSSVARVPLWKMRNGTMSDAERRQLVERSSIIANASLSLEDAPTRTVAQIASTARMVKRKHGLACVIIDYMQLVQPDNPRDARQEQVAKVSRKLKALARELKTPVICLAQLNRQADDPTKPPRLSQLRESGSIEQDADVVIFIHRPATTVVGDSEEAELHVAKQRNGPVGVAKVLWYRHWCRFDNPVEDDGWKERREPAFAEWSGSTATGAF